MAIDPNKFKDLFVSETEDHLQSLNDKILELEKNVQKRVKSKTETPTEKKQAQLLLDEMMRSSHTIKSSSATMGFHQMAFLTHVLEDVFDYARHDQLQITPEVLEEIFKALDLLTSSLEQIKEGGGEQAVEDCAQKLKNITGVATQGVGPSQRTSAGAPVTPGGGADAPDSLRRATEKVSHIKVPIERLDALLDLTEELLIDRLRLESTVETLEQQFYKAPPSLRSSFEESIFHFLKPASDHLGKLVSNLQYHVMQARLVPVGQVFTRFPRMVRDLAHKLNKEAQFEMSGEDLELDRTIVDKLAEPLVHLLRNAVDHGLTQKGTIKLAAQRERDFVKISVEDDGKGIPWEKVVAKGLALNIITSKEHDDFSGFLKSMNRTEIKPEIINLLFHSRLSTKDEVTETSGRGVGLSVVKQFADSLGGNLTVESPLKATGGSRFSLELPLTLAIINALLVRVGEETFATPFSSIERVVQIAAANIRSMADQDVAVVDETRVPLVPLQKIFSLLAKPEAVKQGERIASRTKIARPQDLSPRQTQGGKTVVLIKRGQELAGLVVDELLDEEEIIVKPLPEILRGIKGFAGSTILGNGETALILDVVSLLHNQRKLLRT